LAAAATFCGRNVDIAVCHYSLAAAVTFCGRNVDIAVCHYSLAAAVTFCGRNFDIAVCHSSLAAAAVVVSDVDDVTSPLTFLITEKNDRDILGQVTVPLSELTSLRTNRPLRRALEPHKKCPNAVGELTYEAWISAGQMPSLPQQPSAMATVMSRADDDEKLSSSTLPAGLRKLKDRLTSQHSPVLRRSVCGLCVLCVWSMCALCVVCMWSMCGLFVWSVYTVTDGCVVLC